MESKRKYLIGIMVIMLMANLVVAVDDETIVVPADSFDINSWFRHFFNLGEFSVVGNNKQCNTYTSDTIQVPAGSGVSLDVSSVCSSGHGLIDVFTGGWNPYMEFFDSVSISCTSGCNVEIYCCDEAEPSSDSDCRSQVGAFSEVETASCTNWDNSCGDGKTGYRCPGESCSGIPFEDSSYNYCTDDVGVSCWYYSGSGNQCDNIDYPGEIFCPSFYQGSPLYSSESSCEDNIEVNGDDDDDVETSCSSLGTDINSCFNRVDCIWTREGCKSSSDAGCTGLREIDCNQGTNCKWSGISCSDDGNGNGDSCGDGECLFSERFGLTSQICKQDCEKEVKDEITIQDLTYGSLSGQSIEILTPGDKIKVSFNIETELPAFSSPYLVEAGIIPLSTAQSWGMAQPSGFFSLFAIGEDQNDACCEGQENVADNKAHLINVLEWGEGSERSFNYELTVPRSTTVDQCGDEKYWDDSSSEYVLYAIVKNGCYADGYRNNVFVTVPLVLNLNDSISPTRGEECSNDFECGTGETCLDIAGDYSFKKYCTGGNNITMGTDASARQSGLTKSQIKTATTPMLLGSVCTQPNQCDNESQCNSLQSLIEIDVLTDIQAKDIAGTISNKITDAGAVGGGIVATVKCAAILASTGPGVIPICGAVGLVTGFGLNSFFDNLAEGSLEKTGLCVKEPGFDLDAYFGWAAFFDITGDEGTDGFIITLIGTFLFFILYSRGGRR